MAEEVRITVTIGGRTVEVEPTLSTIEVAPRSNALTANVGRMGQGVCGACRCRVRRDGEPEVSMRLACETHAEPGMKVSFVDYFTADRPHRYDIGQMANAMAQAIVAQAAFPHRQVISMSGDGGFAMLMGDFLSLAQLGLPVKVVVFNNGALGFIELEQKSTSFVPIGTELDNPNFAAMVETVGIRGISLEKPDDVEPGIAAAFAHDGPVLIDAVVNRMELAMPPAVNLEMAKGFSLYMVKAILNGQADQVIDLAQTNLWR
ncbi:Pyruvate dehydrogenase (cytochrome) [Burkholderia sp. BT03]|nr:thiamine pyrophosphate-dependent enzyme [Paraburkholderia hospita]EUC12371.1 Pyruvate dehydrogenase (cytochrome) [Burkholderia sp. BT03]